MLALRRSQKTFFDLLSVITSETFSKRGAVVLKRKFPMRLHKIRQPAKTFRSKNFVYEVVKDDRYDKKDDVNVVLTSYVEGLGKPGDVVDVRPFSGYEKYILPGLAVYATPENIKKYANALSTIAPTFSSKYSLKTLKMLAVRVIGVKLNDAKPWTLEPWHMRVAFRMNGFIVPESAIEMPPRPISGPHKEQHNKEFYVTVNLSDIEKVKVRCRIHLTGIYSDPIGRFDWIESSEPLFEEDRAVLDSMPKSHKLPFITAIREKFGL